MKKTLLSVLLALAAVTQAVALESSAPPRLSPSPDQAQVAALSAQFLGRYHYKAVPLDDALSERMFDRYLKALDPERIFFSQSDIDRFTRARTHLDDAILQGDLQLPFAIFNRYEQRVVERLSHARGLLKQGFDFDRKEDYRYRRDKEPWPGSEDEMQDLWRKRVKNDWLRLKLVGKDDTAIRETLDKRYANFVARTARNKSDDAFQIFMNAYTMSVEPHTNYLGVSASDDFDISMRLSLVGIGAVVQERGEYIIIKELVSGGPAAQSGKLAVGDRLVGIAQGEDGAMMDMLGGRVDEAVKLIRGAKDSTVLLNVLPADAGPDGKHKLVALVRDKISLEQQAAKKAIVRMADVDGTPRRVGVISLPTFYQDFEARRQGDKDYRSATRDVSRLLDELKKENVAGVLIDLRNNGGGSLAESIELTGLFIDKGPVVQQRNADGKVSVESDEHGGVAWDGPLGVLINRSSASASEIFAAAMQDYGRGVIIGEPSFGKGTVQTMVNLNHVARDTRPKLGEIKMTVAQFFRINGGTTQLRGVTPDIRLPAATDPDSYGESSYDNALPWVQIKPAAYTRAGSLNGLLPALAQRHQARVAKDKDFQYLLEDVAEAQRLREKKTISLNEAERRKERDAQEARLKSRNKPANPKQPDATAALRDDGLQAGERSLAAELAAEKARKELRDVLLDEAAHIVSDQAELAPGKLQLATAAERP